jgi:hypothetical protein
VRSKTSKSCCRIYRYFQSPIFSWGSSTLNKFMVSYVFVYSPRCSWKFVHHTHDYVRGRLPVSGSLLRRCHYRRRAYAYICRYILPCPVKTAKQRGGRSLSQISGVTCETHKEEFRSGIILLTLPALARRIHGDGAGDGWR